VTFIIVKTLIFNFPEVLYLKKVCDPFDELFIEIYNEHYRLLVKYLSGLVYDLNTAEDLSHDIFLRIYKSRNTEITGVQLRNYLKKAARNIAIDYMKKIAREEAKSQKLIPELMELDENFYLSLESYVIEGEVLSTVRDVLDDFSERNRKIFISRIIEHKTRKQISSEEKISSYTIKKIEDEILFKLREKLKQYL